MTLETFEGSWEEIQAHTHELVGHRVRVIVLDAENGEQETEHSLQADTAVKASPEEIQRRLQAFEKLKSQPFQNTPPLSDFALSRESMYDDERL